MDTLLQQQLKDVGYTGGFDLASLLEACSTQDEPIELKIFTGETFAVFAHRISASGSSPLEAAVNLYLALHPKQ